MNREQRVLKMLDGCEHSGRFLREELGMSPVAFYELMESLEARGLVRSFRVAETIRGQTLKLWHYRKAAP